MEKLVFKDNKEMRAFFKQGKVFTEPERLEEVKDEVPSKPSNKRKSKANASKVRKSAKDKD